MSFTPMNASVIQVTHPTLGQLATLWREDWLEEHSDGHAGAIANVAELEASLRHHDFLQSDSFWLLAAEWSEPGIPREGLSYRSSGRHGRYSSGK